MARSASTPVSLKLWLKRLASVVALMLIMDGLLFGAAGRLNWPAAWLLTGLYFLFLLFFVIWNSLKAPGLMEERSRTAENVKTWDKVITSVYTVLLVGLFLVAGLDAGRFGWFPLPPILQGAGLVLLVLAGWIIFRTVMVNYYLSRYARIQSDRGQQVVSDGPYRVVRHPMYAALMLFMPGLALLLGSGWALLPAGLIILLYFVRTALEDRMLQSELPGYREYAGKVKYRLIPGVW